MYLWNFGVSDARAFCCSDDLLIWRSVVLGFHSAFRIPKSALPYATMLLLFCCSGFPLNQMVVYYKI
jgi:hypothetical protein